MLIIYYSETAKSDNMMRLRRSTKAFWASETKPLQRADKTQRKKQKREETQRAGQLSNVG